MHMALHDFDRIEFKTFILQQSSVWSKKYFVKFCIFIYIFNFYQGKIIKLDETLTTSVRSPGHVFLAQLSKLSQYWLGTHRTHIHT